MEPIYLENDYVRFGVKAVGAELCSFVKKDDGREYIWQADANFWARHAPVLFPVVGKLLQNQFLHHGEIYNMPQHGFARDLPFVLREQTQDSLVFELTENPETLAIYPFRFSLQITYVLHGHQLEVRWQVRNTGTGEMFFSIGAHPAFNLPLVPGPDFEAYSLTFSQPETLARYLLDQETGLFNGQTEPVLENMAVLPLRYQQFEQDAMVFKDFRSDWVTLTCDHHPQYIKMTFAGFPYLGIWTKCAGAPFLCLEPWYGLAGSVGDVLELRDKEGIQRLAEGEVFNASYTIEIG